MPYCKNNKTKIYKGTEPSPTGRGFHSSFERVGKRMKGKDKTLWEVKKTSNGSKRWVKVLKVSKVSKMKGGANQYNNPCFVAFTTNWCSYCHQLKPQWEHFQNNYVNNNNNKNIHIINIDCEEHPDIAKYHGVSGYPTIKYLPNGLSNNQGSVHYQGERNFNEFSRFLSQFRK